MRTREEQISELVDTLKKPVCRPDYSVNILKMWLEMHIQEAEERARAECAADTRRLEWLGDQCVHVYAPSQCAGGIGCGVCLATHKPEIDRNLRHAIDAAMEGGNG